jgi:predicted aspartyl protease
MNILFFGRGITALAGAAAGQAARPVRRGFVVWLILALRLSLLAATPDAAAPFSTSLSGSVSIPAEITGHVMFVNVLVNGCGPFRVMVDTGCSFTLVSPELAEAAGAPGPDQPEDSLVARNGMGDPTEVQRVMLETVELGAVRFEGVPAAISDSFAELSAITGRRIDGALGFPLFQDLFLGLDFPNRRLLLGSQWPADAPAILGSAQRR